MIIDRILSPGGRLASILALSLLLGLALLVAIPPSSAGPPALAPTALPAEAADQPHVLFLPVAQSPAVPPTWIDTQDRAASRALYLTGYLGSQTPDSGWTGSIETCEPGTTSEALRAATLRRINYFRAMAGVYDLTGFDETLNVKAQAAALMMSANRELSHTPAGDWTCYSAAGAEGAGHSNLSMGSYGPDAITHGYMTDPGDSNYFVGHRRYVLSPYVREMGVGDIPWTSNGPATNALWVFDDWHGPRLTRDEFVAWPPPGYVPYQVVYPRWSLSYPAADFSRSAAAMTRNGQPISVQTNPPVNGYADNTLVWEPQVSFDTDTDTIYQVILRDVLINNQPRTIRYEVILFDGAGTER